MNDKRIYIEEENNHQSHHWQSSLWEDFIEPELLTMVEDPMDNVTYIYQPNPN